MSEAGDNGQTRREFFRSVGRTAVAAALLAGGAAMAAGRAMAPNPAEGVQTCTGDSRCGHCGASSNCPLPAALSFRRHGQRPLP